MRRWAFLLLLLGVLLLIAPVSQRYAIEADLSSRAVNTISNSAEQALDALPEDLEVRAYVPDLPVQRAQIRQTLAPYLRHSTRVRLTFIDPNTQPELARSAGMSRQGELHLLSGTRREIVDHADPGLIDQALTRLALRGERWIVALNGQGEMPIDDSDYGIGHFVKRVETLGYRVIALDARQIDRLPDNTAMLLIAGPQQSYSEPATRLISDYIASGGRVLWLSDQSPPEWLQNTLGARFLPGFVVDAAAARYRFTTPDYAIVSAAPALLLPDPNAGYCALQRARAMTVDERDDWVVAARLQTGAQSWNETGSLNGRISRDPAQGEVGGPLLVGAAWQRHQGGEPGRIALLGDAAFISNAQIGQGDNGLLSVGLIRWLTANQGLADAVPGPDLEIRWNPTLAAVIAIAAMGLVPLLYLLTGWWLRRRRQRA